MQYISLLPKYIKLNYGGVFSCAFACVNVGHWKISIIKVKLTMYTVQRHMGAWKYSLTWHLRQQMSNL